MSDEELLEEVAQKWIDCGGDAEGVEYCWLKLRDKVKSMLALNKEDSEEDIA